MSVIIKDMEMPERCDECSARHIGLSMCTITLKSTSHSDTYKPLDQNKRPDWCPLVELPEKHGDLIDQNKLIENKFKNDISYAAFVNLVKRQVAVVKAEGEE